MNMQMIHSLFALFSGLEDTLSYAPLVMTAVQEVSAGLRAGADAGDVRLCYLAAAVTNLRFVQMNAAKEKMLATYAGTVTKQSDHTPQIRAAEQLLGTYRALCSDLLEETSFFFMSV